MPRHSQTYHPFSSTSYELHTNDSEVSRKRYQYVGKERDGESGLYYYGARYYADWLCRFVSVDPLKDDYPYYTTYQYAGNKPISYIDLDGLEEADRVNSYRFTVGLNFTFGGNQESGANFFASFTHISSNSRGSLGLERGIRLGVNLYDTYKGSNNTMFEATLTWYAGLVIGNIQGADNMNFNKSEFQFAGSNTPANVRGFTWGFGGVNMLTSKYKGVNISGIMGTQYLKGGFGNTSITFNHSNDAFMVGSWLKKGLPPTLGFLNRDWDRTTELSASLDINSPFQNFSTYARVSLFTPAIKLTKEGRRDAVETGETRERKGQIQKQEVYKLDPNSHGTLFSFWQIGGSFGRQFDVFEVNSGINYSFGNPRPLIQNRGAHGSGYRYPLIEPNPGMSPNQSINSIGGYLNFNFLPNE